MSDLSLTCPNCSARVSEGDVICVKCGTYLVGANPAAPGVQSHGKLKLRLQTEAPSTEKPWLPPEPRRMEKASFGIRNLVPYLKILVFLIALAGAALVLALVVFPNRFPFS